MFVYSDMYYIDKQQRNGKNGAYQVCYLGQENNMPQLFIIPDNLKTFFEACVLGDEITVQFQVFRGNANSSDYWRIVNAIKK